MACLQNTRKNSIASLTTPRLLPLRRSRRSYENYQLPSRPDRLEIFWNDWGDRDDPDDHMKTRLKVVAEAHAQFKGKKTSYKTIWRITLLCSHGEVHPFGTFESFQSELPAGSRVCTVLKSPWILGEVLEKSLNSIFPWKVLKFLCKSLKRPWIFFNFECSSLERIFWCFLVVQDRI